MVPVAEALVAEVPPPKSLTARTRKQYAVEPVSPPTENDVLAAPMVATSAKVPQALLANGACSIS
ncbi:unannotated protein [freshwater metagenome]|uniref:Unannotated protein n=1 Tax=freshwater metagenome TaxID=449393 RepID=A0A6J7F1T8_9ZZZZ